MKRFVLAFMVALALPLCLATSVLADNQWQGGNGVPLNHWDEPTNWDLGMVPQSATDIGVGELNVARFLIDGTDTLIDSSVNATAFAVQLGYPVGGAGVNQSASNTLTMTGGTLTSQGNFLMNIGRGTNILPAHLVQFNMSGGLVNAAGITVPEAFTPAAGSVGINAEMHVSGNSVVNTDLLRLGAQDSNSKVTISGDAQVNLTDDNNGFANGQLWLESFEFSNVDLDPDLSGVMGTSLLDIRDNGVLTIHGGVNGITDDQARSLEIIQNTLIPQGWIVCDGGAGVVEATLDAGVITLRCQSVVLGDANDDGDVNSFDIAAFGMALFEPAAYALAYPSVDVNEQLDMNGDDTFNSFDIPGFGSALGF